MDHFRPAEQLARVEAKVSGPNVDRGNRASVSVASVTTAYNAERRLSRQMDALLRQTRPLQEIVVVDDGMRRYQRIACGTLSAGNGDPDIRESRSGRGMGRWPGLRRARKGA